MRIGHRDVKAAHRARGRLPHPTRRALEIAQLSIPQVDPERAEFPLEIPPTVLVPDRDDPRILAWAWHDHRQALDAARLADRRGLEAASRLPLDGVPIAIKDIIDTAGMPTEIGSPIHRGRVPDRDAFVVERTIWGLPLGLGRNLKPPAKLRDAPQVLPVPATVWPPLS